MLIQGIVRGPDGQRVDGAVVSFVAAPGDVPDIAAVTGGDGRFTVPAPVEGWYRLVVRADGYGVTEVEVDVVGDLELRVELTPVAPAGDPPPPPS